MEELDKVIKTETSDTEYIELGPYFRYSHVFYLFACPHNNAFEPQNCAQWKEHAIHTPFLILWDFLYPLDTVGLQKRLVR